MIHDKWKEISSVNSWEADDNAGSDGSDEVCESAVEPAGVTSHEKVKRRHQSDK